MRRGLILWVVIGCALLINGPFLVQRVAIEAQNDTVELVVDGGTLVAIASRSGLSASELIARWQEVGVGAVAVEEFPPVTSSLPRYALGELRPPPSSDVFVSSEQQLDLVPGAVRIVPRSLAAARAAKALGFDVGPFVPEADVLEGYPDELETVASTLAELGLGVGVVEFVDVVGLKDLIGLLDHDVLFVHSIPAEELVKLTDEQAVARFHRAAWERQARLLYIHPLWDEDAAPEQLLMRNDAYIEAIVTRLHGAGLQVGRAVALPDWSTSPWGLLAIGIAVVAGALLLFERRRPVPGLVAAGLLVSGPLVIGLLLMSGRDVLARQGAALAVALVFPVLAIGEAWAGVTGDGERTVVTEEAEVSTGLRHRVGRVLLGLLTVLAVSSAGVILVAAALGDTRFLLKLEQFRGVKLAHVLPFVSLAVLWLYASEQKLSVARRQVTLNWKHVLLGVVVLAFGFVFVARTGHDLLPVSQLERDLREWLETTLPVRPRTKEFLLGYPALFAGLVLASGQRRRWAAPWLIAGAVVPVSIINTFAHAHVPLSVSILRSWYGLLLGGAVAAVVAGIVTVAMALRSTRFAAEGSGKAEGRR